MIPVCFRCCLAKDSDVGYSIGAFLPDDAHADVDESRADFLQDLIDQPFDADHPGRIDSVGPVSLDDNFSAGLGRHHCEAIVGEGLTIGALKAMRVPELFMPETVGFYRNEFGRALFGL